MKRFLCAILALMLVMGLATTAFAADVNVTIKDNSAYTGTRSYKGYMLMTATISADGINFAYTVNPKYAAVLKEALGLALTATDADIIAGLKAITDRSEQMHHFSDDLYRLIMADPTLGPDTSWNGVSNIMTQAYWLIVDTTDLSNTEFANSLVIVDTIGNTDITITNKPKSTTAPKYVDDENDSLAYPKTGHEDKDDWQGVADYDIGDHVPFTLGIACANDIAEYDYFSFVMQDKVEKGLTFDKDSFEIYVKGVKLPADALAEAGSAGAATAHFLYEIETVMDGGVQASQTLYVYPNYSYTAPDSTVVAANKTNGGNFLQYFAEVGITDHAEINSATVRLDYTCTLNKNAVIGGDGNPNTYSLKFSNNPYDYTSYGKTPNKTTIVLTYKLIVNKVDTSGNPLSGAQFSLHKFVAEDIGTMTEAEAKAAGFIRHPSADTWGKYHKVETVIVNGAGDEFTFNGLDDGFYKLVEDKEPDGYNKIDPIEFSIVASHVTEIGGGVVLTSLTGTPAVGGELIFSADTGAGSLTTNIENHTGSELPSTGGIGTTLFYILGTVMVVGAAVILITRKRMSVEG